MARARRSNTLGARLDALTDAITENHVDTCERLTRLETQLAGLPDRVSGLEKFQNKALGWLSLASVLVVLTTEWIKKHF